MMPPEKMAEIATVMAEAAEAYIPSIDGYYWCIKGPAGLCYWTLRKTELDSWKSAFPKGSFESDSAFSERVDMLKRRGFACVHARISEVSTPDG